MTYTCDVCGGTFQSDWSDEDALREMKRNFGDVAKEDRRIACDDCFRKMTAQLPPEQFMKEQDHV